jgi:hypothetical protein
MNKVIFKYKSKEIELFRLKKSREGSFFLIPAPSENKDGTHISFHPSRILNISRQNPKKYEHRLKLDEFKTLIFEAVNNSIEKMKDIDYAVIQNLKIKPKIYKNQEGFEVIDLDDPKTIKKAMSVKKVKKDNVNFLKKYYTKDYEIFIVFKNGSMTIALKNWHGYAINYKRLNKYLDKIFNRKI